MIPLEEALTLTHNSDKDNRPITHTPAHVYAKVYIIQQRLYFRHRHAWMADEVHTFHYMLE